MIEPIGFGANPETAADNAFQRPLDPARASEVERSARNEFRRFREVLEARGIEVVAFPPAGNPAPPDAVFPNNWFSTHPEGTAILYPLKAESRRRERSSEIIGHLARRYARIVDLTGEEGRGRYLEGTGSLVIDERARIAYASVSPRTSAALANEWCELFGYRPCVFTSRDRDGRSVYHTNVVMTVATAFAVVCGEAITEKQERAAVIGSLADSGLDIMEISLDQMHAFAANGLELEDQEGGRHLVLSERAWSVLSHDQRATVRRHADVIRADIDTIESHGGGSARCMMAELY